MKRLPHFAPPANALSVSYWRAGRNDIRKAFSFVEILVVVMIIGLLVGIAAFGIQNARDTSRDTKRQADMQKIRSGLVRFYSDCGRYPTTVSMSGIPSGGTLTGDPALAPGCLATNKYITEFPRDPEPGISYYYNRVDDSNYILCASLQSAPSPTQNISGCVSCGSRACNIKFTN